MTLIQEKIHEWCFSIIANVFDRVWYDVILPRMVIAVYIAFANTKLTTTQDQIEQRSDSRILKDRVQEEMDLGPHLFTICIPKISEPMVALYVKDKCQRNLQITTIIDLICCIPR